MRMPIGENVPGWMAMEDLDIIAHLAARVPKDGLIVEVGSWLGQSTNAWAANTEATVVAVDLWNWMPKTYDGPAKDKVDLKGDPYKKFLANVPNDGEHAHHGSLLEGAFQKSLSE